MHAAVANGFMNRKVDGFALAIISVLSQIGVREIRLGFLMALCSLFAVDMISKDLSKTM